MWANGWRPVPLLTGDKRPIGPQWPERARQDPPEAIAFAPVPHAANTGVLADHLRIFDLDIDDAAIAAAALACIYRHVGHAPRRTRPGTPRVAVVCRAAAGAPGKLTITGASHTTAHACKIEVLGRGQQLHCYGRHPSGTELVWPQGGPDSIPLDDVPTLTEQQVHAILAELAPIIGAEPLARPNGADGQPHIAGEPQADPLRIAAAMAAIPNTGPADWEAWNRVAMALWIATGGSALGWELLDAWSRRNPTYDPAETRQRWQHYPFSPPTKIGPGTLFWLAEQATRAPEPLQPPPQTAPDPLLPGLPAQLVFFENVEPINSANDFVEGLLVAEGMSVVYGETNSGKTFFQTDLALHVACGWPWNGRETTRGAVLYCALEGRFGITNRIAAFRQFYGLDVLPFAILPVAVDMMNASGDVGGILDAIKRVSDKFGLPVVLTVMDTLSRAMVGGNENSPEDMGALVMNGTRIQQEGHTHLSWVHHTGKDQARGARGHSLLGAATDTEIEVRADAANHTAQVTKQRDLECNGEFNFTLKVIEIGTNTRGKPVTSCVVDYAQETPTVHRSDAKRGYGDHQRHALDILQDIIVHSGATGYPGAPPDALSVPDDWWREQFYARAMPAAEQDTKKRAFRRAADALVKIHRVALNNHRVWLVRKSEENQP